MLKKRHSQIVISLKIIRKSGENIERKIKKQLSKFKRNKIILSHLKTKQILFLEKLKFLNLYPIKELFMNKISITRINSVNNLTGEKLLMIFISK